jgi:tetratricopeptide (TPR) repeat protein
MDAALAEYNHALELDPEYIEVYQNRGNIFYGKDEVNRAIADWETCLKLDPGFSNAKTCLAAGYYKRGFDNQGKDDDQVIADLETALRYDPGYTNAREGLIAARKHRKLMDKGIRLTRKNTGDKNPDAEIPFEKNDFNYWFTRANLRLQAGKYKEALADYKRANKLLPNVPKLYNNRAGAYMGLGMFDRAIADLDLLLKVNPGDLDAHNNRGGAHAAKGDHAAALADWNRVLELAPDSPQAGYAKMYLQSLSAMRGHPAG